MQHWTPWGSCLSESHLLRPVFGALDPPPIGSAMSLGCRKLFRPRRQLRLNLRYWGWNLLNLYRFLMIQIQPPLPNTSNMSIPLEGGAPSRGEKFAVQLPSSCSAAVSHEASQICRWQLDVKVPENGSFSSGNEMSSRCHKDLRFVWSWGYRPWLNHGILLQGSDSYA